MGFVEVRKGKRGYREMQLVVPAISIFVYFVSDVMKESVGKILKPDDDGEDVNPSIILGFAIFGILFDVICLIAFARNQNEEGQGINLLAAFMHVAADFARSIATLIAAIMIMYFGFDGVTTDAWAGIIVCVMILMGACYAVVELIKDVMHYFRTEHHSNGHVVSK